MEEPSKIDLLEVGPIEMLIGKIQEVLAACSTLKARVDIIEDHLVFLLSQNPKYLDMLQKKADGEASANGETSEEKPIL